MNKKLQRRLMAISTAAMGVMTLAQGQLLMAAPTFTWDQNNDGNWDRKQNWSPGSTYPNSADAIVQFLGKITAAHTVTLNGTDIVCGTINFDNANGYTIAPNSGHTLTLSVSSGNAALNVTNTNGNGAHVISAPVILADAVNISVTSTAAAGLKISGVISSSGTNGITKLGTGTLELSGVNLYTGNTTISGGTLKLSGSGSIGSSPTIIVGSAGSSGAVLDVSARTGGFTLGASQTLKGIGTLRTGTGTAKTTNNGILAPGNSVGTLNVTGDYAFGSTSVYKVEIDDSTATKADQIAISGAASIASGAKISFYPTGAIGQGKYTLATANSGLTSGFTVDSSNPIPTSYRLAYNTTSLDLIHKATAGLTAGAASDAFVNQNIAITGGTLSNIAPSGGSDALVYGIANDGTKNLTFTDSTTDKSTVAVGSPRTVSGTIATGVSAGAGKSWGITQSDGNATNPTLGVTGTINVWDHASGSLVNGVNTITLPDAIVGYSGSVAGNNSVSVANAGGYRVNLQTTGDITSGKLTINNVSNVAAGGSATINATLGNGQGIGDYSHDFALTYADQSTISGANANLGSATIHVVGKVIDHADGSASVTAGNNFNVLVGTTGLGATVTLNTQATNGNGNSRAGLHVKNLSGLGGATGLLSAGNHDYTASFDAGNAAGTKNVAYNITGGDDRNYVGRGASADDAYSFSGNITGTVYNRASITATDNASPVAAGNAISFTNKTDSYRASAKVTDLSVTGTGFSISGLSKGHVIGVNPGNSTRSGTVVFTNPVNALNGVKYTGTASMKLTNSLADGSTIIGSSDGDAGTYNYTLTGTVSGNTAALGMSQTASFNVGDSLTGLSSTTGRNAATILAGLANATGTLSETWRAKSGGETKVYSDVVNLDLSQVLTGSYKYVLQMSYNESDLGGKSESSLTLGYLNGSTWTKAGSGTRYTAAYTGQTSTVGDWGIDTTNNTVWAVLDHNTEFGVTSFANKPIELVNSSTYSAFASDGNKVVVSGKDGNYVFATAANAAGTNNAFVNVDTTAAAGFAAPEFVMLALKDVSAAGDSHAIAIANAINTAGMSGVTAYYNGLDSATSAMLADWSGYAHWRDGGFNENFDVLVKFENLAGNKLAFDFSDITGGASVSAIGVVPEPTSLGLIALPALGLLARRRRVAKK